MLRHLVDLVYICRAVTAACGRLMVRDCHDLGISLLTPLNPIVSCSSMLISFAPLRSTYPSMQEDLLTAGLDLNQAGKWNLPIVLEDEGREMKESVVSCSNTTIDGFHLIDLPLQGDGLSDSELDKLAKELEEEIESKGEKEELWKSLLCSPLTEWLCKTGLIRSFLYFLLQDQRYALTRFAAAVRRRMIVTL